MTVHIIYKIIYILTACVGTWEVYVRCEGRHGEPSRPGRDLPWICNKAVNNGGLVLRSHTRHDCTYLYIEIYIYIYIVIYIYIYIVDQAVPDAIARDL